jgi:hypothetical protein
VTNEPGGTHYFGDRCRTGQRIRGHIDTHKLAIFIWGAGWADELSLVDLELDIQENPSLYVPEFEEMQRASREIKDAGRTEPLAETA